MNDLSVVQMEEEMRHLPQVKLETIHHFSDGCYARELRIPAGVMLSGALHKTNHHWILSKGKIFVKNKQDKVVYQAPHHGQTYAGDKRIIFAFEDAVFTTFHVTELKDIDEIGRKILGEEL